MLELFLRLAGEADDEGGADHQVGVDRPPGRQPLQRVLGGRGPAHPAQDFWVRVLEGDIEIGQEARRRLLSRGPAHQRDQRVHVLVGVYIVQPRPQAERGEPLGQVLHVCAPLPPSPGMRGVAQVAPVGGGVLRDHQQLAHPGLGELLRLAQHGVDGAGGEGAAQLGNDAEGALVVAALRDLQPGVVARGQLQPLRRHQVDQRVRRDRGGGAHRLDDLLVLLRAGDGEDFRMLPGDERGIGAQAAGDDHPAVLCQRLADGVQRLGAGRIEKAAGVHDHGVGPGVVGGEIVALGAQAGQDSLGIDQRLRAAERDHTHFSSGKRGFMGTVGHVLELCLWPGGLS